MNILVILSKDLIAVFFEDLFFSKYINIRLYHLTYHLCNCMFSFPSELFLSLGWISEEKIDLSRTEVSGIYTDDTFTCGLIISFFFYSYTSPFDLYSYLSKCPFDKLSHTIGLTRCEYKILWSILLEHEPHTSDIVLRMSPVTLSIHISYIEYLLESEMDTSYSTRDLSCDERLSTDRRLVVE